jgi:tetratricopeptide (TPR) repeat protein
MLRGVVFGQKGDFDRAITELDQKVKLDPNSTQGYSKRAELFRQKKDYDRAAADYSQVVKLEPDKANGYVDRGWIYVLKNDLDKAEADFAKALTLHENDASALVGRGLVKSRKPGGKPTDGSADISLALKLEPGVVNEIKKLGVE